MVSSESGHFLAVYVLDTILSVPTLVSAHSLIVRSVYHFHRGLRSFFRPCTLGQTDVCSAYSHDILVSGVI